MAILFATPTIIGLSTASDLGASKTDGITSKTRPVFIGRANDAVGKTIELFKDLNDDGAIGKGELLGSATVGRDGTWSVTPSTAMAAGSYEIRARVTDKAGNVSEASGALSVTIDSTKPTAPTALKLDAASDSAGGSGTVSDNYTSETQPTVTGTGEAGTTITLFKDANANGVAEAAEILGTALVDEDGAWSVTLGKRLTEGANSLKASQTDVAGNRSVASAALTVTVDSKVAAPTLLDLATASDTMGGTGTATDNHTQITTPTITGKAEAGAEVELYAGEDLVGTAIADSKGVWSLTTGELADGQYALTAKQTDKAGNVSVASTALLVTIDSGEEVPAAPELAAASDTGAFADDALTNDTTPTFNGSGLETGSKVEVFKDLDGDGVIDKGELLGSATVGRDGTWSVSPKAAMAPETYEIRARVTDKAGNVSEASGALSIRIDTAKPTAPAALKLDAASDSAGGSGTVSDNYTSETQPTVTGTGEAGASVTLFKDANANGVAEAAEILGTALVDEDGAWSVTLGKRLTEGANSLKAMQTDVAGNRSVASAALTVTVDSKVTAPTLLDLATASDTMGGTGTATDNHTQITTPTITGKAEAGAEVELYAGEDLVGTAIADSKGVWSLTTEALADGEHTLTARQTDKAGNVSVASEPLLVTIDSGEDVPAAPMLAAASDTGAFADDALTNDTTPTFNGSVLETGSKVEVFKDLDGDGVIDKGELLGSATVGRDGTWSVTSSTAMAAGSYAIRARVTDRAGNVSEASDALSITIDTGKPAAPVALKLDAASDSGTAGDNYTSESLPTLTGTGEAGASVTLFKDANANGVAEAAEILGTALVGEDGAWSVTLDLDKSLTEGANSLKAIQTDVAGNRSVASAALTVTLDSKVAAPTSLDLATASDTMGGTGTTADNHTQITTPTITGKAEAGAEVELYAGEDLVGTAIADSKGVWSLTTEALADGEHTLTAKQTDKAGNVSVASTALLVTIDSSEEVPAAPELAAASDTGAFADDALTNDTTPTFNGSGLETGSKVELFKDLDDDGAIDKGELLGSATVGRDGTWSVTPLMAMTAGAYEIRAQVTDKAGNVSAASDALSITIDTAKPTAPAALELDAASDSGTASDNYTKEMQPTVTGTGEAGATLTLFKDANANGAAEAAEILGTALVDEDGAWSVTLDLDKSLTEGANSLKAIQTDVAGNRSVASAALTVTLDSTVAAPTLLDLATASDTMGDTGTTADNHTQITTPTITGKAEAGAEVELYSGDALVGQTIADSKGVWSLTTSELEDGQHTLTATQTDKAGNVSVASEPLLVTIDSGEAAPAAPELAATSDTGAFADDALTNDTTPTFNGSVLETGSKVEVFKDLDDDGVIGKSELLGSATVGRDGSWSVTPSTAMASGTYAIKVRVTDKAGNVSEASEGLSITIDTAGPIFGNALAVGNLIHLPTNETLDASNLPAVETFIVLVNRTPVEVNEVAVVSSLASVESSIVQLTLASDIQFGDTVTLSYKDPTSGDDAQAVQDASGNDASSLTAQSVTNLTSATPEPDLSAPKLVSASFTETTNATITLVFDENVMLGEGERPPVLYAEDGITELAITSVEASGSTVTLTTNATLGATSTVFVSQWGGIQDSNGNALYGTVAIGGGGMSMIDASWLSLSVGGDHAMPLIMHGNGGSDVLDGGNGNDELHGGSGDDWLGFSGGIDTVGGGAGADTFAVGGAVVASPGGRMIVSDFDVGEDHIDLSDALASLFSLPSTVSMTSSVDGSSTLIGVHSGNAGVFEIELQNLQLTDNQVRHVLDLDSLANDHLWLADGKLAQLGAIKVSVASVDNGLMTLELRVDPQLAAARDGVETLDFEFHYDALKAQAASWSIDVNNFPFSLGNEETPGSIVFALSVGDSQSPAYLSDTPVAVVELQLAAGQTALTVSLQGVAVDNVDCTSTITEVLAPVASATDGSDLFDITSGVTVNGGNGADVFSLDPAPGKSLQGLQLQDFQTGSDIIDLSALVKSIGYGAVSQASAGNGVAHLLDSVPAGSDLSSLMANNDPLLDNALGAHYVDADGKPGGAGLLTLFADTSTEVGIIGVTSLNIAFGAASTGFDISDIFLIDPPSSLVIA